MEIPVYNSQGEQVDLAQVDETVLGGKPNLVLIRQAIVMYEANARSGTAQAKTRSEVVRSTRKPWRQKGTGRARHGDRGSPIWKGGGVTHGPRARDYRQKMSSKARRRALHSAFLAKAADAEVIVIDRLELPEPKTRHMAAILDRLGVDRTFLVVLPDYDATLWRCTRNIEGADMTSWSDLNTYAMIRPRRVIFTREALDQFLEAAAREHAPAAPAGEVRDDG